VSAIIHIRGKSAGPRQERPLIAESPDLRKSSPQPKRPEQTSAQKKISKDSLAEGGSHWTVVGNANLSPGKIFLGKDNPPLQGRALRGGDHERQKTNFVQKSRYTARSPASISDFTILKRKDGSLRQEGEVNPPVAGERNRSRKSVCCPLRQMGWESQGKSKFFTRRAHHERSRLQSAVKRFSKAVYRRIPLSAERNDWRLQTPYAP